MKFGKIEHPEIVDFTLPNSHPQTIQVLKGFDRSKLEDIRVGCAKWNRTDLKNFYPRGTKEELAYYSTQFNAIELNASFYRMFPAEQFSSWENQAEEGFRFFPKVPSIISHIKRLKETERLTDDFVNSILSLKDKLGMPFLQLRNDFGPKNMDRLARFFRHWPMEIPLAAEFRHPEWFENKIVADELNDLMRKENISHIITDTSGRRDVLHMRLTTNSAFIRFNAVNDESDFERLDDWLMKIEEWVNLGLKNLYFFIHQKIDKGSPLLFPYFIKRLNEKFKTDLNIPKKLT